MSTDPDRPMKLAVVATDAEAGVILTALAAKDIQANSTGGYTSGGQIGIAGGVEIWVREKDVSRARLALREIEAESPHIDWEKFDVGEPEDGADS